ncbi:molybdopterin molybdotransferase MoeA [Streptomyces sp. JJ36]|uniref:molybdopterin molybdotransferase MoeA n=1 Tax=Streptomyces sp. JJ36 TaxID=2736645 RepID=UPI001F34D110|nr:molybdopterin molybdotransferase MoeA [Streptomyces sp. JJ36]MCF6524052.1 molybdopterin molybdenumtransferase MoeA [Streptomyces sp. JJ36]
MSDGDELDEAVALANEAGRSAGPSPGPRRSPPPSAEGPALPSWLTGFSDASPATGDTAPDDVSPPEWLGAPERGTDPGSASRATAGTPGPGRPAGRDQAQARRPAPEAPDDDLAPPAWLSGGSGRRDGEERAAPERSPARPGPSAGGDAPSSATEPGTGGPGAAARRSGPASPPSGADARRPTNPGGDRAPGPAHSAAAPPGATPPAGEASPGARTPHARGHAHGVPWDEALRIAARAAAPAEPVTVPLARALDTVLAAPVEALADLPSFDTSAMDGWVVAGPGPWSVAAAGGILAGQHAPAPLADGEAVRIATGARVPPGATAVLRSERARERGGRLHLAPGVPPDAVGQGTDIRPRGQECRTGDRLLPAGTPVTPPVLGLAAAAGYDALTVVPRPGAEVLVLGDELLPAGLPQDGRIRDALGPMVAPWLTALGADVRGTRRLGDDAEAVHEALATSTAEVLVTTGGTAAGPVDHVRPTLRRLGARLLVEGAEVRPGHPMLLAALPAASATGPERHLVALPGNPLAAVSGLLTLAAPLVRARAGRAEPTAVRATLAAEVPGHPRDTRLVPVTLSRGGPRGGSHDGTAAVPLHYTGPAMLRGIAGADALAAVPPGGAPAGSSVRLLDLPW